MRRRSVIGGFIILGSAWLAFLLFRPSSPPPSSPPAPPLSSPKPSAAHLEINLPPDRFPSSLSEISSRKPSGAAHEPSSPANTPGSPSNVGPRLRRLPANDQPLLRVNGTDLTIAKIFPPGIMRPGEELPQLTLDKFVEEAVDRTLLVQEAQRRGIASDPALLQYIEELKTDLEEFDNLSPAQKAWQFEEMRDMAFTHRLFEQEGLIPRQIEATEIESYYQAHASEYEWVRKRERLKGTPEDQIERRVLAEVRKDLQIPIRRELAAKVEAFTDSLRRKAQIEYFEIPASPPHP